MMQQKVNTHKGGDEMCPWNFQKGFLRLTTILLMLLILALMGCSDDDDDDDDVTAGDLAGRTFVFTDAGFFDPALTGLSARLVFGTATGDTMPFTLTLDGTVLTGTATIGSPLSCPAAEAEQPAGTAATFPVTITGPGGSGLVLNQNGDVCNGTDVSLDGDDLAFRKGDETVRFPDTGGTGSTG
jgi:hypothetical protein